MRELCRIGNHVWWFDAYGTLQEGDIIGIKEDYAEIHQDGCHTGAKLENCYLTKNACLRAEVRRAMQQKKEYKESIMSVEDLVRFLFVHDVHSEYRDYDAEAAAFIKIASENQVCVSGHFQYLWYNDAVIQNGMVLCQNCPTFDQALDFIFSLFGGRI